MYLFKIILQHLKYIKFDYLKYCILNIFGTILEVAGIISLYPLISLLNDKDFYDKNYYILKFKSLTNIDDFNTIFLCAAMLTILLFTIVSFFKVYLIKFQSYFVFNYSYLYSAQLLKVQLSKNFNWFSNQDSSSLIKDTIDETGILVGRILVASANLICGFVNCLIFILIMLLFSNFYIMMCSLLIIIPYLIIYKTFTKKLTSAGNVRFENNQKRYEILSNIYRGIKEIKSRNLEKKFFDYYSKIAFGFNKAVQTVTILSQAPRYLLELIFIILSITILIFITVYFKVDSDELISSLTIIMFSVLRLIPQLQVVYKNYTDFKFYSPSIKNMPINKYDFDKKIILSKFSEVNLNFKSHLEFHNIKFSFDKKKIFEDLDIIISKSKTLGITGESGSGKTTLLNILMGLLKIDYGQVSLDGKKIDIFNNNEYRRLFGYVPQDCFLFNDTLKKNITLLSDNIDLSEKEYKVDEESLKEAIDISQLSALVNQNDDGENMIIGDNGKLISGGEKQRVGIARTLYMKPKILILDEATSAIDKENEKIIFDRLMNLNEVTKIIVSHDKDILKRCDEIYELTNNKIIKN